MIKFKNSGVDWIGDIPEYWKVDRLKNVLKERVEKNEPVKTENILSLTNDRGVIPYSEKGAIGNNSKEDITGYKLAYPNDIVLNSMNVVIGSVGISKYFGAVSPVYYMLYLRNENDSINYYNYLFQTQELQKYLKGFGNGILEIRMRIPMINLNSVKIPIPSSEEQHKIVKFLNEKCKVLDSLIKLQEAEIEKLKEYKTKFILETICKGINNADFKDSKIDWIGNIPQHWCLSRIKYVTRISRGLFNHRPRNDERLYDGKYPFIQTGDVARAKKYITTYSQTLNELGKAVSKEFKRGTLTMTIAANVGDVSILDFDAYFPDSVVGFTPLNDNSSEYLYYIFSAMKNEFIRASIVSTQLNLNIERIKDMYIPFTADKQEQEQIVKFLNKKCDKIDFLIEKKYSKIEKLKEYKKSLIYECVTGKKEI